MAGSLRSRTQPRRRVASGTGSAARAPFAVAAIAPRARARRRRARALPREVDAAERLGVGVPMRLAEVGRALAHPALGPGEVPELARVAAERLELPVHRGCDVDNDVRLVVAHDVDPADLVGLEALHEELREVHPVPRVGIDGVEREAAGVPVVAVARIGIEAREGTLADDAIGP